MIVTGVGAVVGVFAGDTAVVVIMAPFVVGPRVVDVLVGEIVYVIPLET